MFCRFSNYLYKRKETGAVVNGSAEKTAIANLQVQATFDCKQVIMRTSYDGNSARSIFYDSDKSSVRTDIEENIGDYFTQNTPLLDTYTGAAAAYSLRKLRTAYTGDAVEVYNGSSYADIGFNVFGELDTVALAAHCGSNDGFVSKWYDQAGTRMTQFKRTPRNAEDLRRDYGRGDGEREASGGV